MSLNQVSVRSRAGLNQVSGKSQARPGKLQSGPGRVRLRLTQVLGEFQSSLRLILGRSW
jgi:hypothetical protein